MQTKRKLTDAEVLEIRASAISMQQLADKYGISASAICKARNGFTYKKVGRVCPAKATSSAQSAKR